MDVFDSHKAIIFLIAFALVVVVVVVEVVELVVEVEVVELVVVAVLSQVTGKQCGYRW